MDSGNAKQKRQFSVLFYIGVVDSDNAKQKGRSSLLFWGGYGL